VLAALMTAFYMFRLLFVVFWGKNRAVGHSAHHVHESPRVMTWPMSVLALLAMTGGILGVPHLLGGEDRILNFLSPLFSASEATMLERAKPVSEHTELIIMILPLLLILAVIYAAWVLYVKNVYTEVPEEKMSSLRKVIYRKYYIDEIYETVIQRPLARLSVVLHEFVEIKMIDRFVNQTGELVVWIGRNIRYVQTGNVGAYLFFMVLSIILILFLNLFK
jgi:NADH-quinone oxidoreductase subunit L